MVVGATITVEATGQTITGQVIEVMEVMAAMEVFQVTQGMEEAINLTMEDTDQVMEDTVAMEETQVSTQIYSS